MENHNIPSEAKIEAITQNVDVVHKRIAFTNANMRNLTMMAVRRSNLKPQKFPIFFSKTPIFPQF